MNAPELDAVYTALSEALGRTAPGKAPLMLAILALDLLSSLDDPSRAIAAVSRSERLVAI